MNASQMARRGHKNKRAAMGEEAYKEWLRSIAKKPRPNARGKRKEKSGK